MAPSATETVTSLAVDASKLKLYAGGVESAYKELTPVAYSKDLEEVGSDEYAAAKVSCISTTPYTPAGTNNPSIPTTFLRGTRTRPTLPCSPLSTTIAARMPTQRSPTSSPRTPRSRT